MKTGIKTRGAAAALERLQMNPIELNRTVESVIKQEARELCVQYGRATDPGPGFDDEKAEKFRKKVETDVKRVFASRDRPGSVFALIRKTSPALAGAYWWGGVKKNDEKVKERIIRKAGVPKGLNKSAHKAARTDLFAHVPKNQQPVSLATSPQVQVFVRQKKALVGFAKAGWYSAARAIGGRVRRNKKDDMGNRSTEEKFPGWIRKLANKFPGIGGARYSVRGSIHTVEVFSNVEHAADALSENLKATAEAMAQANFRQAIEQSLRNIHRRTGRNKAA